MLSIVSIKEAHQKHVWHIKKYLREIGSSFFLPLWLSHCTLFHILTCSLCQLFCLQYLFDREYLKDRCHIVSVHKRMRGIYLTSNMQAIHIICLLDMFVLVQANESYFPYLRQIISNFECTIWLHIQLSSQALWYTFIIQMVYE